MYAKRPICAIIEMVAISSGNKNIPTSVVCRTLRNIFTNLVLIGLVVSDEFLKTVNDDNGRRRQITTDAKWWQDTYLNTNLTLMEY